MEFPIHGDGQHQGVSIDAIHAKLMRRAELLGIAEAAEEMRVIEMRVCQGKENPNHYTMIQVLKPGEAVMKPSYLGEIANLYPYQTRQAAFMRGTDILFEMLDDAQRAEASEATEEGV